MTSEKHTNLETQCKDLLAKIDELNCMTAAHQQAFEEIVKSIAVAEAKKDQAKKSYAEQLDKGDSGGMEKALEQVREAELSRTKLLAQMKSYDPLPGLHNAQAALVQESRELREKANIALKEARERQAAMETLDNACLAAANNVSNLELTISKATAKKSLT